MINRFSRFIYSISEIDRCWHSIANDVMKEYNLKGPYSVYLTSLYQYPEGLNATELADICSRNKADVSRAMSTFIELGIVERDSTQPRGYRAMIKLTEKGRIIAEQICSKVMKAVNITGKELSAKEREIFYSVLDKIAHNLHELNTNGGL